MTVAVFPNLIKPETGAVLWRIRDFFAARGARIMLPRTRAAEFAMEACGVGDHVARDVEPGANMFHFRYHYF